MTYHLEKPKVIECHDCGEKVLCSIWVADGPETETGYVDEVALCVKCIEKYEERIPI
jgi:DNA-directed RNA polymerase subunit RPC12/RpoP